MDKRVRKMLIESARQNKPLAYSEVMKLIGLDHKDQGDRNKFSKILEDISRFEHLKGRRPMLSAQVMYKGLSEIGGKFYWLAADLGHGKQKELEERFFEIEMMRRCYEFWSNEEKYKKYSNDDGGQPHDVPGSDILKRMKVPSAGTESNVKRNFQPKDQDIDWVEITRENTVLGKAGEDLVIEYEKKVLLADNLKYLADKVTKVKDGSGYDILSFLPNGAEKYIEVKTTTADRDRAFFITVNELEFSKKKPGQYHLYRLYNFVEEKRPIEFFELNGNLDLYFHFDAVVYRARWKSLYS